jgi:hypothetical protein
MAEQSSKTCDTALRRLPLPTTDQPGASHAALAREKPPHLHTIYNSYVNESMSENWNMYIAGCTQPADESMTGD